MLTNNVQQRTIIPQFHPSDLCSDIMTSFFNRIVDQGRDILRDPSKISGYMEDPYRLLNIGLNFIGQDVLDNLINKVLEACKPSMTDADMDPLPIDDITIPYSLDGMTGACAPFLKNKGSALGELMLALCSWNPLSNH